MFRLFLGPNYKFFYRLLIRSTKNRIPVLFCNRLNMFGRDIPVYLVPSFALMSVLCASKESKTRLDKSDIPFILRQADGLYDENKYSEVYDMLLPYKKMDDVEVLWRISRALYNMSKQAEDKTTKKKYVIESYDILKQALEIDDQNFAVHKWYAILLDCRMAYDGIKARINHLMEVKEHMLKAMKLNNKDATTIHMIGFWCFNIADMPWYQRQIASTIFATPPESTYQEALRYFLKAEEVEPNFYSQNLLMLGKTYLRLENTDKARHYLILASKYPARTDDDLQANKEAAELLKKLS